MLTVQAPLIHWLPNAMQFRGTVVLPDASLVDGLAEDLCRKLPVGAIVQFERFGFVRVDRNTDDRMIAYYCHR